MGELAAATAERRRTGVRLNLPELAALLVAAQLGAEGSRDPDLRNACQRVGRARKRREDAVRRAAAR